nr:biotin--[acetyl-CoA-carboxylase] ligase [Alphaproteobacteria bacterium]
MSKFDQSFIGRAIVYDQLESTNAEALRLAGEGERGPVWIHADMQTAGRGRNGRRWHSDAGNLAASLLFAPDAPVRSLHQLSLVAGVAVLEAVVQVGQGAGTANLKLKWPNDLLFGRAKAGGILIESTQLAGATVA